MGGIEVLAYQAIHIDDNDRKAGLIMSNLGTRLYTFFKGRKVGEDRFGSRYYQQRKGRKMRSSMRQQKRWVLYKGEVEASKIPPEWHAWLHYTVNSVPEGDGKIYSWQREHQPNQTGTPRAYRPDGHMLCDASRAKTGGDYEAWTP